MSQVKFNIDFSEQFAHLAHAPIVEAVIHWQSTAENKLEQSIFLKELKDKLPEYPNSQPQQELGIGGSISGEGSSFEIKHVNWHGFRLESSDKLHVAQFNRNGLVFSRLKPYEDWQQFESEALRLWRVYYELAGPSEIQRLGVRFINSIGPVRTNELGDLLEVPPRNLEALQLPFKGFMHQDLFEIPGHRYNLNVIQTIQPTRTTRKEEFAFILDLDVFSERIEIDDEKLKDCLQEMRWIKNKAFFTILKADAIDRFKEPSQ